MTLQRVQLQPIKLNLQTLLKSPDFFLVTKCKLNALKRKHVVPSNFQAWSCLLRNQSSIQCLETFVSELQANFIACWIVLGESAKAAAGISPKQMMVRHS